MTILRRIAPRLTALRLIVIVALAPLLAVALAANAADDAAESPPPLSLAVFPFELIDSSLDGRRPDQQARLAIIDDRLLALLRDDGRYRIVDPDAVRNAARQRRQPMHRCNGCPAEIAARHQADLAMTAWVQKVSNLILNVNLALIDPASGRTLYAMSVDIRGNTDASWLRGVSSLTRNRLFGRDAPHIARALQELGVGR